MSESKMKKEINDNDYITRVPGATTCWTRRPGGKETDGIRFNREVLEMFLTRGGATVAEICPMPRHTPKNTDRGNIP
jgi:hypothetical protein